MANRYFIFFLLTFCFGIDVGDSGAKTLSGIAEWQYGEFESEEDGRTLTNASHFSQKYSFLYQKNGLLQKGRGGRYDFGLGAEWVSLDTEVNDQKTNLDSFKVLYQGEVLLAPGGLPFRLHLYSRDLHSTTFFEDSYYDASILRPGILSDINNGQQIQTGATLLLGIRNGSYMGEYRDVLSQFPKVLIDYKETYVRNLEARTPQHYRERNLAFVSLNKKNNWFHYRVREFTDFEDEANDYSEKSYLLGTVDHTGRREWVNMTNWIKISADASYTTTDQIYRGSDPTQRYDLNLFAVARRRHFTASEYSNFQRIKEGDRLQKFLEVPLFLSGEISRDTSWKFRLLGSRDDERFLGLEEEKKDVLYASARLETFRLQRFIWAPTLEAEKKEGDTGEGYGVRGGVEIFSNRRYRPKWDLFGSYSVARFGGETSALGEGEVEVDYWEQQLIGRAETDITSRLRTGISEELVVGSGTMDRDVTEHMSAVGTSGILSTQGDVVRDGDVFRSTTTWFGEHSAARLRLTNRLEVSYDYLETDADSDDRLVFKHHLRYDRRYLTVQMRNEYTRGEALGNEEYGTSNFESANLGNGSDWLFTHGSSLHISPGRAWEANAWGDYHRRSGTSGSFDLWRFRQDYRYNFFTINGMIRKVADLREEFEYEGYEPAAGEEQRITVFTLTGNWYPTARTLLGAKIRHRIFDPGDSDETAYYFTSALNYQKLQLGLEYAFAENSEDRREHRWEVKVRKLF